MPSWRSTITRTLIAVLATVLLAWPFCNYLWTSQQIAAPSAATGGHPVTISAPVADLTSWFTYGCGGWRYSFALLEAVLASSTAILLYMLLARLEPRPRAKLTCCRRCGSVLKGLAEPRCPACGERI